MSVKQYQQITEIPKMSFEGYIWMSDREQPEVLHNKTFDFSTITLNPFIIEALLYNATDNISIHIQHTGQYQIYEYNLKQFPHEQLVPKEYLPHRLGENVKKVIFKQLWIPETDDNCEGMEVLTLKAVVFCGFIKKEKK